MAREFYNPKIAISYNAPLTMVVSMRSYGKTYGFTKEAIRDWMRDRSEFVYVRRYDSEMKTAAPKIFDDIIAHDEFPGWTFKMQGYTGYVGKKPEKPDGKIKWHVICHCIPLSQQATYKGVAFPNVKKIIFDEFIRVLKTPPGYLPDDVGSFLDLYKTVSRDRKNVRAYLLGNSCDLTNPYFAFAGIRDEPLDGFSWHNSKSILLHYAKDAKFAEEERETVVGRLVKGTPYEAVMIDNEFANGGDEFVGKKPKTAKFRYAFLFQGETFAVWVDEREGLYYVNGKAPGDAEEKAQMYAMTASDMRPNLIMIERASPFIKGIMRLYRVGVCRFENAGMRERFLRMMRLVGLR